MADNNRIPISEMMTAEFKRDYIAIAARIAFVLIVLGEVALAVSIPWYLQRSTSMAHQVARLRLLDEFDALRRSIASAKPASEAAKAELQILSWNSNQLAGYLREESKYLTPEEIAELQKVVRSTGIWVGKIRAGQSFSRVNKLNTSNYINQLIPKSGVPANAAK